MSGSLFSGRKKSPTSGQQWLAENPQSPRDWSRGRTWCWGYQKKSLLLLDSSHSVLFSKGALDTAQWAATRTTTSQAQEHFTASIFFPTAVFLFIPHCPLYRCCRCAHFIDKTTKAWELSTAHQPMSDEAGGQFCLGSAHPMWIISFDPTQKEGV